MGFRFVQMDSVPYLSQPADPVEADVDAAARQLDRDYRRWSRLLVGTLALTAALVGIVAAIAFPLSGVPLTPVDALVVIAGAVVGSLGLAVLVGLHRSGRRIVRALSWWMRAPYRSGARPRSAAGWLAARTVAFEPPVFARVVCAALTGLAGVLCLGATAYPAPAGSVDLVPGAVAVGILLITVSAGISGGVLRLVSGLAEGDPVWVRLRRAARGAFGRR